MAGWRFATPGGKRFGFLVSTSYTALTFRVRDNRANEKDYTVAVTFSLKAFPRFGLGHDTVSASSLVGY